MPEAGRLTIGAFQLDRSSHALFHAGRPVAITFRSLEALAILAEAGGELVDRAELTRRLWPDTYVDDSSLAQLIARLRRALAEHDPAPYIETVPKRGYRLTVPVIPVSPPESAGRGEAAPRSDDGAGRLTPGLTTDVGRRRVGRWAAAAVVTALGVALLPLGRAPDAAAGIGSVDADLREARRLWHKRDDGSLQQSQEIVSRVLQVEPASARAYALLADLMALRAHGGPEARIAAERALHLDPDSAEGHASLGFVRMVQDWDWAAAGPLFERAVALDPRLPHARQWLAVWRALTGDIDGARGAIATARALDPLAAHLLAETAGIEYFGRNYSEAITWARRALAADPHFAYAYSWWSWSGRVGGLAEEAFQARHDRITFLQRRSLDAVAEQALQAGGIRALLAHDLRNITPSPGNGWSRALLHAQLGETDAALAALDEAVQHRNFLCIYLGADPALDPIRAHPAFPALLARVGLGSVTPTTRTP